MKARGRIMTVVCLAVLGVLFLLSVGRSGGATPDLPLVGKSNAGAYVVVEDFEDYARNDELYAVWDDGLINGSGAQIFLDKDPNFVRNGTSVMLEYNNTYMPAGKYVGAWMEANPADLEVGPDWTASGANRLVVNFRGDGGNSPTINDRMWVELEDTSSNAALVLYDGDANDLTEGWWHEWNIDLGLFDVCGVDLTEVGSISIGFGGYERTGQTGDGGTGYVWFDDIGLYGGGDVIPGLIAHWKFDEGSGGTAYDSVGNNYGIIYGATWTAGQIDGALEFDGLNDYVDLSSTVQFDDEDFTITGWIRTTSNTIGTWEQIWMSGYKGGGKDLEVVTKNNGVYFYARDASGSYLGQITGAANDGIWHHFAALRSGNTFLLYFDGVLASSASKALGDLDEAGVVPRIGNGLYGVANRFFDGAIDDVRIYDRALSGGEVQGLYEAGLGDMVAHWTFDEGSGSIAYDSAGDNDGTIHGATWTNGVIGTALDFDGVKDYVEVGDSPSGSLDFGTGSFTIGLWFKTTDTAGELVDKSGGGGGRATGYSLFVGDVEVGAGGYTADPGKLCLRVRDGLNRDMIQTINTYDDGNWHHLAAVRAGSGSANLDIYVDGTDVPTDTMADQGAGDINNSYSLSIGAKYDSGESDAWEDFLDGTIDDVRIYNRALSGAEVQALYQGGLVNTAPIACIVGGDQFIEADSNCEGRVVLDGSCSSDVDSTAGTNDDINDFDWYEVIDVCEPNSDIYLGSGEVIECNLGLGEHMIVLEVTDKAGTFDSNEVVITVEDVTPPELSVVVEPNILWPPNGKMVEVRPEWEVSDNCDEEVEVSLVDITMSAAGDINDYAVIGDDGSIYLRARKGGGGSGRIYTLRYEAVDDSGNVTEASASVTVPHSRGPRRLNSGLVRRLGRRLYGREGN